MLMAADEFENSDDDRNRRFGELLRLYVDVQTLVRMSMPVPKDKSDRYVELNNSFQTTVDEYVGSHYNRYSGQLGPFFTELAANTQQLATNMTWLEDQPIRRLQLTEADIDNDLRMIFRNKRMGYITHLTIRFKYRQSRQEAEVARAMVELSSVCLEQVTLLNMNNRMKLIPAMFLGNRNLPKGCSLIIGRDRVATRK